MEAMTPTPKEGQADTVERREDMSATGRLTLHKQEDGDVVLAITGGQTWGGSQYEGSVSIEFCMPGSGGGRSSNTLNALRKLFEAMQKDNGGDSYDR